MAAVSLHYPDANAVPWPLNHHAYVHACADRLRKDLSDPPRVHLPLCHLQQEDVRGARLRIGHGTVLFWDELRGWSRRNGEGREPLVPEAGVLPDPELLAAAVYAPTAPGPPPAVEGGGRSAAHPVDPLFERRLAAYRRL